jgi:2'-5' RNA ligase
MTGPQPRQRQSETRMVNHWLKPGWYRGRQFYSWYLTFEHCSALHDLARYYGAALAGLPVDIVPVQWLHLTIQSIGVAGEVSGEDLRGIGDAAATHCAAIPSFDVTIGRMVVHPEAVVMLATPSESLRSLRSSLRNAIADVWGMDAVLDTEGSRDEFVPHVTLAYSRGDEPAAPLIDAVRAIDRRFVTLPVNAAHLLSVQRDVPAYRWSPVTVAALGRRES